MKKSDLISGKHIVETRFGDRFLVAGDYLPDIDGNGYTSLTSYKHDLTHIDSRTDRDEYDIDKVYEIIHHMGLPILAERIDRTCNVVWERKPELSEVERVILKNVHKDCKYIVRDGHGKLCLFSKKPKKFCNIWVSSFPESIGFYPFNHLFKIIKWEDEEPTLIADLLEGKQ